MLRRSVGLAAGAVALTLGACGEDAAPMPPPGMMTMSPVTQAGRSGSSGGSAGAAGMARPTPPAGTGGMIGAPPTTSGTTGGTGMTPMPPSGGSGGAPAAGAGGAGMAMMGTLGGPLMYTGEFTMGMTIPPAHKCPMSRIGTGGMGDNKSPPLEWTGGPAETKSFAIVLFDTMYNVFHWAIWDIPPTTNSLPEGLPSGYELPMPMGAHQRAGTMATDPVAYFGPCSDAGATAGTYQYRLYALDTDKLPLMENSMPAMVQSAIEGAMLEMTVWEGKPE